MMDKEYHSTNNGDLWALEAALSDKLEELLELLELSPQLKKRPRFYVGCCPIHGGDNSTAFNIFHVGETKVGNWRCLTHNCQSTFNASIIGFVWGVLSHRHNNWQSPQQEDKIYPFPEVLKFLYDFLGNKPLALSNSEDREKRTFVKQMECFSSKKPTEPLNLERAVVTKSLDIPSKYFINRGFSSAILTKYDVGTCSTAGREMYMRAVAPIYNDDYTKVIGCTGRSIFEKCPLCLSYHNPIHKCPDEKLRGIFRKWKHNAGFNKDFHMYNAWFAMPHIRESYCAVLVESPGNVWKLEECGIHNSLGMFGTTFSQEHRKILDKSGALAVIVLTDPDKAGKLALESIKKELETSYTIYSPSLGPKDVADTDNETIKSIITPLINKIRESYK